MCTKVHRSIRYFNEPLPRRWDTSMNKDNCFYRGTTTGRRIALRYELESFLDVLHTILCFLHWRSSFSTYDALLTIAANTSRKISLASIAFLSSSFCVLSCLEFDSPVPCAVWHYRTETNNMLHFTVLWLNSDTGRQDVSWRSGEKHPIFRAFLVLIEIRPYCPCFDPSETNFSALRQFISPHAENCVVFSTPRMSG